MPTPHASSALSLPDALPIWRRPRGRWLGIEAGAADGRTRRDLHVGGDVAAAAAALLRSEEHTSELQSPVHLVCRPLLEKKNNNTIDITINDSQQATPQLCVI